MKAVIFPGSGVVELVEKPEPELGPNEVLLGMRAAGVCGSDLHFMEASAEEQRHSKLGKGLDREPSVTPGHEMAGVIEAVGEHVTRFRVGDRVTVHHYSGCGACRSCRMGWDTLCANKEVYTLKRDGGFQDKVAVKEQDCVAIPDQLSFSDAAFIACGAGTSFQALRRGEVKAGDTVATVGLGPVGLSGLLWAQAMGCRTIGLDTNESRRSFAATFGVDHMLDPLNPDLLEQIDEITGRGGADVTLETAGNSPGRRLALDVTRVWGTAVFISFGGSCEIDAPQQLVQRQLTLRGSWMFSMSTLIDALQLAADREIPFSRVVTNRCVIEDAPEAILAFAAGGNGKIIIEWEHSA